MDTAVELSVWRGGEPVRNVFALSGSDAAIRAGLRELIEVSMPPHTSARTAALKSVDRAVVQRSPAWKTPLAGKVTGLDLPLGVEVRLDLVVDARSKGWDLPGTAEARQRLVTLRSMQAGMGSGRKSLAQIERDHRLWRARNLPSSADEPTLRKLETQLRLDGADSVTLARVHRAWLDAKSGRRTAPPPGSRAVTRDVRVNATPPWAVRIMHPSGQWEWIQAGTEAKARAMMPDLRRHHPNANIEALQMGGGGAARSGLIVRERFC